MKTRPTLLMLFALGAGGLSGCAGEEEDAAVAVGLSTDLAVGFEVRRVETTATLSGEVTLTESWLYTNGELRLPKELMLPPAADGESVEVSTRAFGEDGGEALVSRSVRTTAVAGRTLLVPLSLDEACEGVACSSGLTCEAGACKNPYVAPDNLPEYDPGWTSSAKDACKSGSSAETTLTIGKGQEGYSTFADGDTLPIEAGPQGGHHAWLALRVTELRQTGSQMKIEGAYPGLGVELPAVSSMVTLRKADEGGCELYAVRFQVDYGLEVEDILGQPIEATITLTDPDGASASATRTFVIGAVL